MMPDLGVTSFRRGSCWPLWRTGKKFAKGATASCSGIIGPEREQASGIPVCKQAKAEVKDNGILGPSRFCPCIVRTTLIPGSTSLLNADCSALQFHTPLEYPRPVRAARPGTPGLWPMGGCDARTAAARRCGGFRTDMPLSRSPTTALDCTVVNTGLLGLDRTPIRHPRAPFPKNPPRKFTV